MFDWIQSIPEFASYRPFMVYNVLAKYGDRAVAEECVNDGATDAYMACMESGDYTGLSDAAGRNAVRYFKRESRRRGKTLGILSRLEYTKGQVGVAPDSVCSPPLEMRKVSDDLSMTVSAKALCNENGEGMLDKVKEYIHRAVKALKLSHKSHPDYDIAEVLTDYYCNGQMLIEIYKRLKSFRTSNTLSYLLTRDLRRVQAWWKTAEGAQAYREIFGCDPGSMTF